MNYSRRILIFFVCVLLVFASAYLASMSGNNTQEALNQRVLTGWEARSNGKWGVVYDLTADVFKKKVTRSGFVEKANIRIEKFSIKEVKVLESGEEGLAIVEYTMNQMGFSFDTAVKEKWLWEDSEWRLDIPFSSSPFTKNK